MKNNRKNRRLIFIRYMNALNTKKYFTPEQRSALIDIARMVIKPLTAAKAPVGVELAVNLVKS